MMLQQFEHLVTLEEEALVAQLNLMTHLSNPAYDEKAKSKLLFKTIDLFSEIPNSHHLNTFLSQLESSHKEFYTKALAYLK